MSVSFSYILHTYGYWPFALALLAMALTFPLKQPYKALTGRIKTTAVRELLDRVILLFPVAIGIALWYIHNVILKVDESTAVSVMAGAATGALAIVYYNLFGRYVEKAILKRLGKEVLPDTPATSGQALATAAAIANGTKDAQEVAADTIKDVGRVGDAQTEDEIADEDDETDEDDDENDEDDEYTTEDEIADIIYDLSEATGIDEGTLKAVIDRMRANQ